MYRYIMFNYNEEIIYNKFNIDLKEKIKNNLNKILESLTRDKINNIENHKKVEIESLQNLLDGLKKPQPNFLLRRILKYSCEILQKENK